MGGIEYKVVDRNSVIKQTIQNLVEAGVLLPDECKYYKLHLQKLSTNDLILELIAAQLLREQTPSPISFYPIDIEAISMN
ncbi:hypothetical protein LCGC14_0591250 [marine sediment metagenome]|uniref:Uncharacterized protein n=1 Tax=marine sediment metagenome TaxID=412755 RepID=A0A0F9ULU2_9ZZZZ